MRTAPKILMMLTLVAPVLAQACVCELNRISEDRIKNSPLFFGKILAAKASEVRDQGRLVTKTVTFEYRVEHVIRGQGFAGQHVEEVTGGSAVCGRIPPLSVGAYFLSSGALGDMCGLLKSPLYEITPAEWKVIEATDGGSEAMQWIREALPELQLFMSVHHELGS